MSQPSTNNNTCIVQLRFGVDSSLTPVFVIVERISRIKLQYSIYYTIFLLFSSDLVISLSVLSKMIVLSEMISGHLVAPYIIC